MTPPATPPTPPDFVASLRAGFRTSEFWLSLLAIIATNVSAHLHPGPVSDSIAQLGNLLITGGYGWTRMKLKLEG